MNPDSFFASVQNKNKLTGMTIYQQTLWYAGINDWDKAHELIQDVPGKDAALLHAYLHRVEGDLWNADYWYQRAGSKMPANAVQEEWKILVQRFC